MTISVCSGFAAVNRRRVDSTRGDNVGAEVAAAQAGDRPDRDGSAADRIAFANPVQVRNVSVREHRHAGPAFTSST
jgi:hypothetical protein